MVHPLQKRVWQFLIMYFPKRNENICPSKDLLENVHYRFIHNNSKLRITPGTSRGQGVKKLCFTHVIEYYSKIKSNQLLIQHGWISKALYQVKKASQTQKNTYHMILFIWNFKKENLWCQKSDQWLSRANSDSRDCLGRGTRNFSDWYRCSLSWLRVVTK